MSSEGPDMDRRLFIGALGALPLSPAIAASAAGAPFSGTFEPADPVQNLHALWKRPVHVETLEGGKGRLISYDGEQASMKEITPSQRGALALGQGTPPS